MSRGAQSQARGKRLKGSLFENQSPLGPPSLHTHKERGATDPAHQRANFLFSPMQVRPVKPRSETTFSLMNKISKLASFLEDIGSIGCQPLCFCWESDSD